MTQEPQVEVEQAQTAAAPSTHAAMLQQTGYADHNRAVVVSVARFHPGVALTKRPGAERDAKKIHRTLSKLGFKVKLHSDPSSEEIYQIFHEESGRGVKDCFLAVLSSHGEEGCVFGADGKAVRLSHIFACFKNPTMDRKAKLFLIQACRGGALDDGVQVDGAEDVSDSSFTQYLSVPVDTAVMYATAPGYGAIMSPLGSVFLQTFCALLEDEDVRKLELTRLLTRVSHRVAYTFQGKGRHLGGKKEMPCFLTRLTREVFLFVESAKDAGISVLIGSENGRMRTPSIS
uniref:Caspase-3-like n=1 Tax=Oryzias latipes TaxID=8090 RepID=A0A3P9LAB3_ORYLA